MKCLKKLFLSCAAGVAAVGLWATNARAEIVGSVDWADSVSDYTSKIQNYGGVLMDSTTTWWATGAPDADADGNGYAWDAGDPDYVAGWRTTDASQYITLYWENGIVNVSGDDLAVSFYSGPKAAASVWASVDGTTFTQIGELGTGTPGYFLEAYFDLDGFFGDSQTVSYVKVLRTASGPQTGMFFDAVGAAAIPEPGSMALLSVAGLAGLLAYGKRKRKGNVS